MTALSTDDTVVEDTAPETDTPEVVEAVPERPAHLPDQFETVEKLAKSYRHSQQELTKKSQQLAELSREHDRLLSEFDNLLAEREVLGSRISTLEQIYIASSVSRR